MYMLVYIAIYGYLHGIAVDMASPAKVSVEGRICAEVLHSLSKAGMTHERVCEANSCKQTKVDKRRSTPRSAYSNNSHTSQILRITVPQTVLLESLCIMLSLK